MSASNDPLRENLHIPKYGSFVSMETRDDDMDSDEDDVGDVYQALDYKDMTRMMGGSRLAEMKKPKRVRGTLHDFNNSRAKPTIEGCLHLPFQWWNTRILRTRRNSNFHEPKDNYALSYALRQDDRVVQHGLVPMFFQHCEASGPDITKFLDYVSQTRQRHRLTFQHVMELLDTFEDSLPDGDKSVAGQLKKCFWTDDGILIERGIKYPLVFRYLPQLLPLHFLSIVKQEKDSVLQKLEEAIVDRPWIFGFKKIMSKNFKIVGTEANIRAYKTTGFFDQLENLYKDALELYEYLKESGKKKGHTRIARSQIMQEFEGKLNCEEALSFLAQNKIIKELRMDSMQIMLYSLWYSEMSICKGIDKVFRAHMRQPWILNIDLENHEDFENVRKDEDQLRAARMINRLPVVVVSGKGGCGKTTVVTTVLSNAERPTIRQNDQEGEEADDRDCNQNEDDENSESLLANINLEPQVMLPVIENNSPESNSLTDAKDNSLSKYSRCPNVLYLAPTGKAAKLLGNRADTEGYTLHQVIWSFRAYVKKKQETPEAIWKFSSFNTLVVDECSLVSVENFSTILDMLLNNTNLKKIVLLGDVRQLPSIDPGNFLSDAFKCLKEIGCAVELTKNHRAESQLIVENATKISLRRVPIFDPQRHFKLHRVPNDPQADFHDSVLLKMLKTEESLKSDKTSHIVAFKRDTCMWINEMCCQHYNQHSIRDHNSRPDFRPGDKVCMFKNAQIPIYEWTGQKFENILINVEESEDPGMDTVLEMSQCEGKDFGSQKIEGPDASQGEGHVQNLEDAEPQNQTATSSKKKDRVVQKVRLCNGEIFFIKSDKEILEQGRANKGTRYIELSDEDPKAPMTVWVTYKDLRKMCNMKHAWAKTIHTFQGSECEAVVYVVGTCGFQNWQHVYTAVTRGRKAVHIVSVDELLERAIERYSTPRNTSLAFQLKSKLPRRQELEDALKRAQVNTPVKVSTDRNGQGSPKADTTSCASSYHTPSKSLSNKEWNSPSTNTSTCHTHSPLLLSSSVDQVDGQMQGQSPGKWPGDSGSTLPLQASKIPSNVLTSTCVPGTSRSHIISDNIIKSASPIQNVRRNLANILSHQDSLSPKPGTSFSTPVTCHNHQSIQSKFIQGVSPLLFANRSGNVSCDSQWSEADEGEMIQVTDQTAADFFYATQQHGRSVSDSNTPFIQNAVRLSVEKDQRENSFTKLKPSLNESDILFDSSSFDEWNSSSSSKETSLSVRRGKGESGNGKSLNRHNSEILIGSNSVVEKSNKEQNGTLKKHKTEGSSPEWNSRSLSLLSDTSYQDMSLFARIKAKSARKRQLDENKTQPSSDDNLSSSDSSLSSSLGSRNYGETTPPKQMKISESSTQVTPIFKGLQLSKEG